MSRGCFVRLTIVLVIASVLNLPSVLAHREQGDSVSVLDHSTYPRSGDAVSTENKTVEILPPLPLKLRDGVKPSQLDQAYLDAYSILSEDSGCSRFFGGPAAIEALNELTRHLKPSYFEHEVALRMKGDTASTTNYASGFSFRTFAKVELNVNGPFYKSMSPLDVTSTRLGEFDPNTREARVTILLHEIGHMIQRGDRWVLPDDGNNSDQSRDNTRRVIAVCRPQIKARRQLSGEQQIARLYANPETAKPETAVP